MSEWRCFTRIKKCQRAKKYDYKWIADNWMGLALIVMAAVKNSKQEADIHG